MEKEAKAMRSCCPKLTRIENLTRGLTIGNNQEELFVVRELDGKGRGVFLKASILPKDSFVLEYEGEIISAAEADIREQIYCGNGEGCFIMYFTFKNMNMAIDATRKFDSFGRLLNHSRNPNIRFHKPLVIDLISGMPRIAAYALRDIKKGEEIVMDYGIRDGDIPWLKNNKAGFLPNMNADLGLADSSSECSNKTSDSSSECSNKTSDSSGQCSNKTSDSSGQCSNKTSNSSGQCSNKTSDSSGQCSSKTSDSSGQFSNKTSDSSGQYSNKTSDSSGQCSSKTSKKVSYMVSLNEASRTKTTVCNNLNKIQNMDMLPGIANFGTKKKKMINIFGYHFKSFVPYGRKRLYFAAYESFSEPEEIKRFSDEPTKRIRRHESHNDTSVISCCKQLENDKLSVEEELFNEIPYNTEQSSDEPYSTGMSYEKEEQNYELSGVNLRSKKAYCNERSSLTDSIKLSGEKVVDNHRVLGKKYSDSGSNKLLSKRQSDGSRSVRSSSLDNRVNRSEVFQNTNNVEQGRDEIFYITTHGKTDRSGFHKTHISKKGRCEIVRNKNYTERYNIEAFHNSKDDDKENFVDVKSEPGIEINLPLHQSSISLNDTDMAKFLGDSKIEKRSEVILWELPNLHVAEVVSLDTINSWTAEHDLAKEMCRKLKPSECDSLLPEVAESRIQSEMLSRSRQRRGSLSATPQVAVIKPYNPECLSDQSSCKEDKLDAKEGIEKNVRKSV